MMMRISYYEVSRSTKLFPIHSSIYSYIYIPASISHFFSHFVSQKNVVVLKIIIDKDEVRKEGRIPQSSQHQKTTKNDRHYNKNRCNPSSGISTIGSFSSTIQYSSATHWGCWRSCHYYYSSPHHTESPENDDDGDVTALPA